MVVIPRFRFAALVATLLLAACRIAATQEKSQARHVVLISIDGLRPDAITRLGPEKLPTFHALMRGGAYTLNARTDHDFTVTLPNHTAMITGRPVTGERGHNYTNNGMPKKNLHQNKGSYVASVFDVAHDHGLTTALYPSKKKFVVYRMSYKDAGGPDTVAPDNGTVKIDYVAINDDDASTLKAFIPVLKGKRPNFTFLHFRGPDSAGHGNGWMSDRYLEEVVRQDGNLKQVLDAIVGDPVLKAGTVVVVTADHGGTGKGHGIPVVREHYRIPFFVTGVGVAAGKDLYALNPQRTEPGDRRIPFTEKGQPIRNGDAANLCAKLLGLPAVPGSTLGAAQDLKVR